MFWKVLLWLFFWPFLITIKFYTSRRIPFAVKLAVTAFFFLIAFLRSASNLVAPRPKKMTMKPTNTPEMLIARPTNAEPSQIPHDIAVTMTVEALDQQYLALSARMTAEAPTPGYHEPENIYSPTPKFSSDGGPSGSCRIKGNVSRRNKDQKIYHCPGWPDYYETDINPSEGDRWFCSESEAILAGFRRPQNVSAPCNP